MTFSLERSGLAVNVNIFLNPVEVVNHRMRCLTVSWILKAECL